MAPQCDLASAVYTPFVLMLSHKQILYFAGFPQVPCCFAACCSRAPEAADLAGCPNVQERRRRHSSQVIGNVLQAFATQASVESLQSWTGRTQRLRNPHGGIHPGLLQIHTGEVLACKPQAMQPLPLLEMTGRIDGLRRHEWMLEKSFCQDLLGFPAPVPRPALEDIDGLAVDWLIDGP